ncbi:MAG: hypothetical protein JXB62_11930 [Pirellulales bacterium]|nr:hypothetical protein [Pirellulales bacterium]
MAKYYKYKDSKFKTRGRYRLQPLATTSMDERKNLRYPIPYEGQDIWPEKQWQWKKERTLKALADDELVFTSSNGGITVSYKQYQFDEEGEERGAKPFSVIDGIYTQHGTEAVASILGDGKAFPFPKPPALIKRLLQFGADSNAVVMDVFAGSGTTAQAVLELNREDDGNRRFIISQQRYETLEQQKANANICRDVTARRVRGVVEGYEFTGTQLTPLLEEKITWTQLRRAESLVSRVEALKSENADSFDTLVTKCEDGLLTLHGKTTCKGKADGTGSGFTYAAVSDTPLLGEYRDLGDKLPSYNDIAKYVFYTETSTASTNGSTDKTTGKIGEHAGTSYYLLYRPNRKTDWAVDMEFLNTVAASDPNNRLVVYCEKIWVHQHDRKQWEAQHGKKVRLMLVPFNLK